MPPVTHPLLHVVLHQPDIPQNTGNIGRRCVAVGAKLWLVRPLGFLLDARHLKRAGMDYWEHLDWEAVDNWSELRQRLHRSEPGSADANDADAPERQQFWYLTKTATRLVWEAKFEPGDVLVTETGAPVWGYNAELERAMIIGQPTDEMRRLFEHMVAAQQVAFAALRPGVTCADVDNAVLGYFEANDLLPYWRQHTGHAIGLRNHEAPFLDVGDHTVVEPGMVFTIEPGLYSSEIGGFRHSDTVLVTPDGIDILTSYPSDIESLTIPI